MRWEGQARLVRNCYKKFLERGIDLGPLGLERREGEEGGYFCTPKGMRVIGWAGVDGIHYGFIRGYGETVFAVSPMNLPGEYLHPIARSFSDFLGLLLACQAVDPLEQMWQWDRETFDAFLRDNPPDERQKQVLERLKEEMGVTAIEDPFDYVRTLQTSLDLSRIRFQEEYEEWAPCERTEGTELPEWKVYLEGGFLRHRGRDRAGREVVLGKKFDWMGAAWQIPSIYLCAKGLVIDLIKRVPAAEAEAFLAKWHLDQDSREEEYGEEDRMRLGAENPFDSHLCPDIWVNGLKSDEMHGWQVCWIPQMPKEQQPEGNAAILHYQLDPRDGWVIDRRSVRWRTKRRPSLRSLSVQMAREALAWPGPHFYVSHPGEEIPFVHPVTGTEHILTAIGEEPRGYPVEKLPMPGMEIPPHYRTLTYCLTPEPPEGTVSVVDCDASDPPRLVSSDPMEPEMRGAAAIGIIGGADGPTAILISEPSARQSHLACSALHFVPPTAVEWRFVFYDRSGETKTIELIE